jgi:hypothetical protein
LTISTALSGRYKIEDFSADLLCKHVKADHDLIHKRLDLVKPITPAKDAKLQVLLAKLKSGIPQKIVLLAHLEAAGDSCGNPVDPMAEESVKGLEGCPSSVAERRRGVELRDRQARIP